MSVAVLRTSTGDESILSGSLALDLRGQWVAVVELHRETALAAGSAASIVIFRESGAEDVFAGTVRKSSFDDGALKISATIVGAAGLGVELQPLDLAAGSTELPAGLVARAICDAAGERLADGVEVALDALTVPHWTRFAGPGATGLDLLADVLDLGWRALPSGRVWLGAETWPAGPEAPIDTGHELEDGVVRYAPDGAQLLPGQTVGGQRLVRVVHYLGGPLRCDARAAVPGDPPHVAGRAAYLRSYSCAVVSQDAASGLLELQPDAPELGSADAALRGIPLRVGIPGARVTVPPGARVRVAFDGADPRYPYACALDQDPAADRPLALVGDSCGYLSATGGGTAPIVLSVSPTPTGTPGEVHLVIRGPGHRYAKGVSA